MAKIDETMIPVKKTTREKLKELGKKSETYDDVILTLMEIKKGQTKQSLN